MNPAQGGGEEGAKTQGRDGRYLQDCQDNQEDDGEEGPAGNPEAVCQAVHHLVDGVEADLLGIQTEDGVEDDTDCPGWNIGDQQGTDVFVDTDLTDTSGEVGRPGQWGDVRTAEGPRDDHPGGQPRVNL